MWRPQTLSCSRALLVTWWALLASRSWLELILSFSKVLLADSIGNLRKWKGRFCGFDGCQNVLFASVIIFATRRLNNWATGGSSRRRGLNTATGAQHGDKDHNTATGITTRRRGGQAGDEGTAQRRGHNTVTGAQHGDGRLGRVNTASGSA